MALPRLSLWFLCQLSWPPGMASGIYTTQSPDLSPLLLIFRGLTWTEDFQPSGLWHLDLFPSSQPLPTSRPQLRETCLRTSSFPEVPAVDLVPAVHHTLSILKVTPGSESLSQASPSLARTVALPS
jgi:hypothetical protein